MAAGVDLDGRPGTFLTDRCDDVRDYETLDGRSDIDNQYTAQLVALLGAEAVTNAVDAELAAGRSLLGVRLIPGATVPGAELVSLEATGALPSAVYEMVARDELRVTSASPVAVVRRGDHLLLLIPRLEIPMGTELGTRPVVDGVIDLLLDSDGSIRRAELGAAVELETVLAVAQARIPGLDLDDVRFLSRPDLLPNEDGSRCERVSLGVALEVLRLR